MDIRDAGSGERKAESRLDRREVRLSAEEVRRRFGRLDAATGERVPMPLRTFRRHSKLMGRIRVGRMCWYPLEAVEEFERQHTLEPI